MAAYFAVNDTTILGRLELHHSRGRHPQVATELLSFGHHGAVDIGPRAQTVMCRLALPRRNHGAIVMTANAAPAGSASNANRPPPGLSSGAAITVPSFSIAVTTALSQAGTSK